MIKEALEYIVGISKPTIETIGNNIYSDKRLQLIDTEKRAEPIQATTLTSIIDYIKNAEAEHMCRAFIHIVSYKEVRLISELDRDRQREILFSSTAQLPALKLNEFIENEKFMIMLQSMFVQNNEDMTEFEKTNIDVIQKVVGNVVDSTIQNYTDDGISQQASIKTGITTKETVILPSPSALRPYRTFAEVEQPVSNFVFRMKNGQYGPSSALFEADGGAWKNDAMDQIHEYFVKELAEDYPGITIIC